MSEIEYIHKIETQTEGECEKQGGMIRSRQIRALIIVIGRILFKLEKRIIKLENK